MGTDGGCAPAYKGDCLLGSRYIVDGSASMDPVAESGKHQVGLVLGAFFDFTYSMWLDKKGFAWKGSSSASR